jgi:hypothetical protein
LWLIAPQTHGAQLIFDDYLKPFLEKHASKIDPAFKYTDKVSAPLLRSLMMVRPFRLPVQHVHLLHLPPSTVVPLVQVLSSKYGSFLASVAEKYGQRTAESAAKFVSRRFVGFCHGGGCCSFAWVLHTDFVAK